MTAATGYFQPGDSWLHRRHPFTKLVGLGFVLISAFLLPSIVLAILFAAVVAIAAAAGIGRSLLRAMRIPAVLLISIVVVNALFYPGAIDRLLTIGPFSVTREGLTFGLTSAARLLVAFVSSVTFLFTTLADDLLEALIARGASHKIAFIVLAAVQMVPRLQSRTGAILDAQQSRGLAITGSIRQRVRALVPLIGPVILGSLIDVRERTFALEARGFGAGKARTAYRVVADPPVDRVIRPSLLLGTVAVIVLAVTGTWR